jgi:hypothetical protein
MTVVAEAMQRWEGRQFRNCKKVVQAFTLRVDHAGFSINKIAKYDCTSDTIVVFHPIPMLYCLLIYLQTLSVPTHLSLLKVQSIVAIHVLDIGYHSKLKERLVIMELGCTQACNRYCAESMQQEQQEDPP